MRLTEFIEKEREKIIGEWVAFAATLMPWAKGMSEKELRDHAAELLAAVVTDMKEPQSRREQTAKSQGLSAGGALAEVGHKHAMQRLASGFNLDQLVSEYRALRASILRLWAESQGDTQGEVTRFNEAIDESLTESTTRYSEILDHTREQFLAILGHDLRTPLGAIVMGASLLTEAESLDNAQARVAMRILNSARRMDRMVKDLLDLTRTRLGAGIPVKRAPVDLGAVCRQVIVELEASQPDCELRLEAKGDLSGEWDGDRLTQVVSNLVANALQHGAPLKPVIIAADGSGANVVLRVHNEGTPIAPDAMRKIFDPMVREPAEKNATGLGLGLYIAREILTAHGATIGVASSAAGGTTFSVELPRRPGVR